jgi:DNA helicase HerA-like ATPase
MTGEKVFVIGETIEQGYPVGLDLEKLVKRSSGIFGATGTGKSFLTRMVLAGLMQMTPPPRWCSTCTMSTGMTPTTPIRAPTCAA